MGTDLSVAAGEMAGTEIADIGAALDLQSGNLGFALDDYDPFEASPLDPDFTHPASLVKPASLLHDLPTSGIGEPFFGDGERELGGIVGLAHEAAESTISEPGCPLPTGKRENSIASARNL